MFVIDRKKLFVTISAILAVISIGLIAVFGLELSIEFTGGSIIEAEYPTTERPDRDTFSQNLDSIGVEQYTLQPVEDTRYALRTEFLEDDVVEEIREVVTAGGGEVIRESAVGPSVGQELRAKSITALIVVSLGIVLFIAFAFRRVSRPVESWKYGSVAIVALVQDILIPTGVFALLGALLGFQVDLLFVMGILVILGYSVNDTIVVFDRVRENLSVELEKSLDDKQSVQSFAQVVGESLNQTYARSLNTSLTTLVVLICLYIFGGEATNHFALMLMVGVVSGTYSSIFLASPLLVYLAGDKEIGYDTDEAAEAALTKTREERRAEMVDPGLE